MKILRYLVLIWAVALVGCASPGALQSDKAEEVSINDNRKIIKSASLSLSVDHIDETAIAISRIVGEYNGYIHSNNRYSEKRANVSLKVPSAQLEKFVEDLSDLGEVLSKSTSAHDVTGQIIDIDARLKNLFILRTRYRDLLSKANTVGEIISIEKELAEVQTEIDSIEGKRNALLDQVSLSSVYVTIEEKTIYGPLGYVGKGVVWVISKLFVIK